ncbi:hypothetical protein ECED1_0886 [Escherichia coli ED1a]|uniref:Peptidase n=1 Tax=Escherichia coli O81 (strain ED1a) TaxID=585397 RepID=B7MRX4_ECO81|nr:hypothetical protein ECED1_0886 [Escherichia coli ED1a]
MQPEGKNDVKRCGKTYRRMSAHALLPLLMLLTACNNTPAPLKTGVICGSVPESLTRQTPVPVLPQHMIWADVADWGDRLVDALDSCNADKAAIAGLERQRTARMNTHEK